MPVTIASGERIAQLVLMHSERIDWNEVDSLDSSSRGTGGFGSTGTK